MVLLRKIKDRIKKIIPKQKGRPGKLNGKGVKKPVVSLKEKKETTLGTHEVEIGKTKFSNPPVSQEQPRRFIIDELPGTYGKDKIVLQTRDPWWLHSYWEITIPTKDKLRNQLGDLFHSAKVMLRVYDVSNIVFDGRNAHRFFDIEVGYQANNWYISTAPGRSWCADIGLLLVTGEFITIARSNVVHTPLEGPSWITDEEWMIPEEMFARLYGMGFGFGKSSPLGKAWQERLRKALFSGILASPGMASMASPVKKVPERVRKFWLVVNTELIVYGATEPDALVTVQGKEIKLRPDGTFSLRFALPDGNQVIPVKAVSSDKVEERTITPIVAKETK